MVIIIVIIIVIVAIIIIITITVMAIVIIMIDLCITMSRGEMQSLLTYSTYDSAVLFPMPFVDFISNAVFLYNSVGRVL